MDYVCEVLNCYERSSDGGHYCKTHQRLLEEKHSYLLCKNCNTIRRISPGSKGRVELVLECPKCEPKEVKN